MRHLPKLMLLGLLLAPSLCAAETVRLMSTSDIWLTDTNDEERNSSAGGADRFKIKSIQEMAAIRFDATPAKGREVIKATLWLKRASEDLLRHIRVSTVGSPWVEGDTKESYGPADGATWSYANANEKDPWTWPGSQFVDAIMGNGHTLTTWTECRKRDDGWIAVDITPDLVYALVAGSTDGLAVMEGGTLAFVNNFIYSSESKGNEPYIEVELGTPLRATPAQPKVKTEPAKERARLDSGAVKLTIAPDKDTFCWKATLDGRPLEPWQLKYPARQGDTVIYLEDLEPDRQYELAIVAVAPGGQASEPTKLSVKASPALSKDLKLGAFEQPKAADVSLPQAGQMRVWVAPGLVKVDPIGNEAMYDDIGGEGDYRKANAVWDGQTVRLFGGRGEYVSYQLVIENLGEGPLEQITVTPSALKGSAAQIGVQDIELYRNWYARNRKGNWQPAYCVPMEQGATLSIPDPARRLEGQRNQGVYVDLYIPKNARPGEYRGAVRVAAGGQQGPAVEIPVLVTVYDFQIPDELAFWPELNAYRVPADHIAYYRLAHQHRCVQNLWTPRPQTEGEGEDLKIIWGEYDRNFGPLLDGSAFRDLRRGGVPIECMYLPFEDSWPTPLSPENYNYPSPWPGKGDSRDELVKQVIESPYIEDALSDEYKAAFLAAQRQYVEHFRQKGWDRTEMQCFYGGKKTHRTDFGTNMWWTTDEPYHWDDWMALEFFCRFWTQGRKQLGASQAQWKARADISRPNWQDKILDGTLDTVYIGGFNSPVTYRRCRILAQETGVKLMAYGGANPDDASNTQSIVMLLNIWLNGANGHLPWQTLGPDEALDTNDSATMGSAMIVPGRRFGIEVVGDMRLKAFRDAEQIIEYMALLARKRNLQREQIQAAIAQALQLRAGRVAGAHADDADAMRFGSLKDWQISELRRTLAELIVKE